MEPVGGGAVINRASPSSCRTAPATPGLFVLNIAGDCMVDSGYMDLFFQDYITDNQRF